MRILLFIAGSWALISAVFVIALAAAAARKTPSPDEGAVWNPKRNVARVRRNRLKESLLTHMNGSH